MEDRAAERSPGGTPPGIDDYTRQEPHSQAGAGREQAERVKDNVVDRARSEADQRKQGVASDLKEVSSALERSRDNIQGAGWAGGLLGGAAGQLQRLAEALERKSSEELMRDLRDYARRNPAVYLAGCAAVGFAAARIARAEPEGGTRHGSA